MKDAIEGCDNMVGGAWAPAGDHRRKTSGRYAVEFAVRAACIAAD